MTHSFDFAGASEKLFVLQQLQAASREYCRNVGLCQGSYPYGHDDWKDYAHQIKPIVSGYMIEIAAKVRILQDSMSGHIRPSVFERADKYALEDIPLGKVHLGEFKLSVRESCNKIIHATRVELGWVTRNRKTNSAYTHWSGAVNLFGEKASKPWHLELDATAWCVSIDIYLDHVLSTASTDGIHVA
ncbi:hypothetical protein IFT63_02000 [Stenotrophomonas sp. CFBP 13724]|uniref:hypothetical protein n=1 Tax=Stenotrophomonas sp. CFBP 13724 TaxID=2775298 RepID=UPI001780A835|nr:hypothetical protein [Stenotrophomonas sp. CFBP 13724]MBD8642361.1 hypothetical protein [Stenotrophomonas sp. CFBP 13724]